MALTGQGLFFSRQTLAGVAVTFDFTTRFPGASQFSVVNHHASNNYTVSVGAVDVTLPAGVTLRFPIQAASIRILGTGDVSVIAVDAETPALDWFQSATTALLADGSVTTVKLADGALSADAAGRLKMADDFFTAAMMVAGAGGKFTTGWLDTTAQLNAFPVDSITNAVLLQAVVNGAFVADDATRALLAASFLGNSAVGRALMQDGYFDLATFLAKVDNDAIDNTFVQAKFAANAFGADADSRAAFIAGFFNFASNAVFANGFLDVRHAPTKTVTAFVGAGDETPTAAQMLGGVFTLADAVKAAGFNITTDTAANLDAAFGAAVQDGNWFRWTFVNNDAADTGTLVAGAGVTLNPAAQTVAAVSQRTFLMVRTGVGAWTCFPEQLS